jgi:sec-independent protein translocase protein TatA
MEFFGMGFGEILFILVVALIIWGPGRIVDIGRNLGKIARSFRKATSDLTSQITREIDEEEHNKKPPSPPSQ